MTYRPASLGPTPATQDRARRRVAILCADFVFSSSVYALLEDLERVGTSVTHGARFGGRSPRFDCVLVAETAGPVSGAFGVTLAAQMGAAALPSADVVIVPAFVAPPLGWQGPDGAPVFPRWMLDCLSAQYDGGALVCGILSGAYALAAAGLLDGELATTHWIERPEMARLFPRVVVDPNRTPCVAGADGRVVTTGSNGAYHNDVVEYLVARLFGAEVVDTLEGMRGAASAGPAPDAQALLEARGNRTDARVRAAQDWLAVHFADATPVQSVCAHLGMPSRTLARRFSAATGMSLLAYVQALRIVNSQRLLERTRRSIEDIAAAVGYTDVATFRKQFRRRVGMNPARYRRTASAAGR